MITHAHRCHHPLREQQQQQQQQQHDQPMSSRFYTATHSHSMPSPARWLHSLADSASRSWSSFGSRDGAASRTDRRLHSLVARQCLLCNITRHCRCGPLGTWFVRSCWRSAVQDYHCICHMLSMQQLLRKHVVGAGELRKHHFVFSFKSFMSTVSEDAFGQHPQHVALSTTATADISCFGREGQDAVTICFAVSNVESAVFVKPPP